ncbi:MAG: bifunctional adenosylcobinamide kinase/adenosylcobinamide-phosphate guanylyltransferase, partial [Trebonia sp.]
MLACLVRRRDVAGAWGRFSPAVLRNTGEKSPQRTSLLGREVSRRLRGRQPGSLSPARRLALSGRPRRGKPFRVLVLGGARSGKSLTAERLLGRRERVDYVACGPLPSPADPDWAERVQR